MSMTLLVTMLLCFAFSISYAVFCLKKKKIGIELFEGGKLLLVPKATS